MHRRRRLLWLGRGTLLLIAAVLTLELGFRLAYGSHYGNNRSPYHRDLLFRRTWEDDHLRLNGMGFRDDEFSAEKPAGVRRILALGDAYTFGEGIEDVEDRYTEVLERRLNEEGGSFEVLNLSEMVWEVDNYLAALKDPGLSLDPDMVVVELYINDIEDRSHARPVPDPTWSERLPNRLRRFLGKTSFLYWYTVKAYEARAHAEFWLDYVDGYTRPDSADWKRFVPVLQELLRTCEESDLPVIVAVFPYLTEWHESHPFIGVYENVARVVEDAGATAVNLFPILIERDVDELRAGLTRWTGSEAMQQIVAEAIHRRMRESGMLDPAPAGPAPGEATAPAD